MSEEWARTLGYDKGFEFGAELRREMDNYGTPELEQEVEDAFASRDIARLIAVKYELYRRKAAKQGENVV